MPHVAAVLARNTRTLRDRVHVVPVALGYSSERSVFSVYPGASGESTRHPEERQVRVCVFYALCRRGRRRLFTPEGSFACVVNRPCKQC